MALINRETCWIRVSWASLSAQICWKWLLIIEILLDIFLHLLWTSHCGSKSPFLTLHTSHTLISQWRHNGRDGVSNHQPHDFLVRRLFRRRSKKTSKLRVIGLCAGNSPVSGVFPAQSASNAENVVRLMTSSCSWRGLLVKYIALDLMITLHTTYANLNFTCCYIHVLWNFINACNGILWKDGDALRITCTKQSKISL